MMKAPLRGLCWLGCWLLSLVFVLPTLCLLLGLIGWEYLKEWKVGTRLRLMGLRVRLVFLRRRERREEEAAVPSVNTPRICFLRAGWSDAVRYAPPEDGRTTFRDVALF